MTAPGLQRITAQDANSEPHEDRTFPDRLPAFPRRTYQISVLSPLGYPITVIYTDITLDRLSEAEANLMERGYMPAEVPSVLGPNAPAPAVQPAAPTGEAPICPVHTDRRMKVSNYGGWFCTATNAITGEKCTQKVK